MVTDVYGADNKVSITGDTMTGPLTMQGSPPIIVPGGVGGRVLTSDTSGNVTLQPAGSSSVADWLNVVTAYGADPTGTTDSTAAIQAAINARLTTANNDSTFTIGQTQVVYIPYGRYLINSGPLVLGTPLRSLKIVGAGATLASSGNAIFDFGGKTGTLLEGDLEISGLCLDATGGHVFQNANVHGKVHIHHCDITQRSTGYGIWWQDDIVSGNSAGSGIYLATFDHISYWLGTGTRTVEAWHFVTSVNEGFSNINFEYVNGPNPPGNSADDASMDTSHYQYYLTCSGPSGSQVSLLSWRNCEFSNAYGGLIKVGGAAGVIIEGCGWGNAFDGAVSNDAYTFIADSVSGSACNGVVIRNCFRDTSLGNQAGDAPPYDVSFAAGCENVRIDNYTTPLLNSEGPYFNLNGCKQAVVLENANSATKPTISNQGTDTIVIGQGAITVGGNRVGYTSGGTGSVGSTTTETTFAAYTVPANDPAAGATYEIEGIAVVTTSTTAPTLTFDLWYGGTKICAGTAITLPVSASGIYLFRARAFFDSATTCMGTIQLDYLTSGTSGPVTATQVVGFTSHSTVTVTPAQSFNLSAKFSAADGQSLTAWYVAGRKS